MWDRDAQELLKGCAGFSWLQTQYKAIKNVTYRPAEVFLGNFNGKVAREMHSDPLASPAGLECGSAN